MAIPDGLVILLGGASLAVAIGGGVAGDRWRRARAANRLVREQLAHAERMAGLGSACRDLGTGHTQWSEGFHAILGLAPGSVTPSLELFLSRVHPADRAKVEAGLADVRDDGAVRQREFRIFRADGQMRVVEGRAERVSDSRGRPKRLDATVCDVTERRRLEDELDGLIRELWRSNEELEQFAYVASHDLRQPLRVVGSYVSLMEEELQGGLSEETAEYMAFVRDGVRRMDRLITDLLAYSRVGRMVDDRPVAIGAVLEAVLADLSFDIVECGATVTIEGTMPTVLGDPGEMERLFINLIGNALKYRRPDCPPRVRVVSDSGQDDWLIRVIDNGIGIPPDHAERVFGIFQRLHSREAYEGTGVGLAIARKIVERRGGSIRVEAATEGAILLVRWPKIADRSEEGGPPDTRRR